MPYLAPTLKRWHMKSSQIHLVKGIKSRFTFKRNKQSNKSTETARPGEADSYQIPNHHLETRILGSIKGAGDFLGSQNPMQREWLDRTIVSQQGRGEGAIPDGWSV